MERRSTKAEILAEWRKNNELNEMVEKANIIAMNPKNDDVKKQSDASIAVVEQLKKEEEKQAEVADIVTDKAKAEETAVAETKVAEASKETKKEQQAHEEVLVMDQKLAAHIVTEAQRSNISVTDLIRKVIDLPTKIDDKVMIAFALSDAEQDTLAKRYEVDATDDEAVKKNILKELQQFIGNKK